MDVFLVDVNKKSIGKNIRRNNREKKLQRESAIQDIIFEQSCEIETVDVENDSDGSGARIINESNSSSFTELSREIEVIADIS